MDADTLISILFVGVIILFQLFGTIFSRLLKQGKSAKGAKAAKAGGLLKTLTERINREIQIAMEQAAKAQQRPSAAEDGKQHGQGSKKIAPRPPARPPRPIRAGTVENRPAQQRTTRFETVDKKPARKEVEPKEADLIDELRQGLLQAAAVAPETPVAAAGDEDAGAPLGSPLGDLSHPSIEGLRRAVIWSEILSPPVALRE